MSVIKLKLILIFIFSSFMIIINFLKTSASEFSYSAEYFAHFYSTLFSLGYHFVTMMHLNFLYSVNYLCFLSIVQPTSCVLGHNQAKLLTVANVKS